MGWSGPMHRDGKPTASRASCTLMTYSVSTANPRLSPVTCGTGICMLGMRGWMKDDVISWRDAGPPSVTQATFTPRIRIINLFHPSAIQPASRHTCAICVGPRIVLWYLHGHYTVRHKNTPNFFYRNLKKGYSIWIIFGTHIYDTTGQRMAV